MRSKESRERRIFSGELEKNCCQSLYNINICDYKEKKINFLLQYITSLYIILIKIIIIILKIYVY